MRRLRSASASAPRSINSLQRRAFGDQFVLLFKTRGDFFARRGFDRGRSGESGGRLFVAPIPASRAGTSNGFNGSPSTRWSCFANASAVTV
jgi:hypothetical protein